MAITNKTYDSVGGFSVDKSTIVDELKNAKNINTLEIKNSFYQDSNTRHFIMRGINTSVLSTSTETNTPIPLDSNTINFVESSIIGVNDDASVMVSTKLESGIKVSFDGTISELSTMRTIISDNIPNGQLLDVNLFLGGPVNSFSYQVTRTGTARTIKWVAYVKVVSIDWT